MTSFIKTFWTYSAVFISVQDATIVVGRSSETSSAWVGPDSATSLTDGCFPSLPSSSPITCVRVNSVSGSIPFATSTITCPSGIYGAAVLAVDRTKTEGTAKRRISFPVQTSSMSFVKTIESGMIMPGRFGCLLVLLYSSTSFGSADHTITS